MVIGNKISTLLGERRESISDFARGAGISYPIAHSLYHAKGKGITWEVMGKTCAYFELGPGDLFPALPQDADENKSKKLNK